MSEKETQKTLFNPIVVGSLIRERRVSKRLTQASLSKLVGINSQYLSDIERGKHLPSNQLMKSIFDELQIKITVTAK